jgi:hypothetical protein
MDENGVSQQLECATYTEVDKGWRFHRESLVFNRNRGLRRHLGPLSSFNPQLINRQCGSSENSRYIEETYRHSSQERHNKEHRCTDGMHYGSRDHEERRDRKHG